LSEEREIKVVKTGYIPRKVQAILHNALKRFNVLVCHRRFGKTVFSINEMIDKGLSNPKKNPQYAYFAPYYGQAKRVAWDYFKDFTKDIPGVTVNEADLRIEIPRPDRGDKIRFMLLGADNPGSIRGIYLDGAVLDEYAEMDVTIWGQVIRPALADRLGWAIFIGTPKGQNQFFDMYEMATKDPEWFTAIYKASETKILPKSELAAAGKEMTIEEYQQEFECSFTAALIGAYYGKEMEAAETEGRILGLPYDVALPVDTFWDLGIDDTTAIWFIQDVGPRIHVIDYHEMSGEGLPYYAKMLLAKPYVYSEHTMPWDANHRNIDSGITRADTWKDLMGKRPRVLPKTDALDRIHATRTILPRCYFDKEKTERGRLALSHYQRKWDAKNKIFQMKPKHDWASNGADAFGAFSTGFRSKQFKQSLQDLPRQAVSDYDVFGGGY